MTLLATPSTLSLRAVAAAGPLRPLAESLAADLGPLLAAPPSVPAAKAWLSRAGGRCPRDAAMLDFDPYAPNEHRCPRCGERYRGELHDRWWATWYQLWLAERAVHAALLAAVRPSGAAAHARLADTLLERHAELYLAYPNADNALGPTRPFFSTYLESIWLLQLSVALSLREAAGAPAALGARVRDELVEPSARLIAGFDEGMSNRQVWHNAALLAAGQLLGDAALAERAVFGTSGVVAHLERGLLADGSWYEGENYHLFAHRGLWYGVELCAAAGIELPAAALARFAEGFATPFLTALPDFTFPARRDSQYAVSLRQWRFAELAELGLARADDPRLRSALAALYAPDVPRGDPGRWRSTAEAERNEGPSGLTRADLGWRALLCARAELPALDPLPARSALLAGQGLAIFRREAGRVYAALDYGHSGGGHGHPDRLNILLARGPTRWLDDAGTGSYVDPSLHWYRSTLAHNAPLVDGRSQQRVHGTLASYEERGAAGWADALVDDAAPGVRLRRAIVVMDGYLVDELTWTSEREVVVDLPFHVDGELDPAVAWDATAPRPPNEASGAEDGWPHLRDAERAAGLADRGPARLLAERDGVRASAWLLASPTRELWRAHAPGPPGAAERRFHFVRARGRVGRIVSVWSWADAVTGVGESDGALRVSLGDDSWHEHARSADGWHIGLFAAGGRSSIDLAGRAAVAPPASAASTTAVDNASGAPPFVVPRRADARADARAAARDAARPPSVPAGAARFVLGEAHYRRSELSWDEADRPTATAVFYLEVDALAVDVAVRKAPLAFAAEQAENPLDNEHPDTNSDGVQLYLQLPDGRIAAWILVPEADGYTVRVARASQSTAADVPLAATWQRAALDAGYDVHVRIPLASLAARRPAVCHVDLIVNETAPGRERRRGQLVLSGGAGEFVYLRGDRQPPERFLACVIGE